MSPGFSLDRGSRQEDIVPYCLTHFMKTASILVFAAFVGIVPALPARATQFHVTDLGALPGGDNTSHATGINNLGQVVGYSFGAYNFNGNVVQQDQSFLWTSASGMQVISNTLNDPINAGRNYA